MTTSTPERQRLDEVESKAYPGLDRSPKKNWVDKVGGLPSYIERVAKHLHYEKGYPISRSIATAINHAKKMCASGTAFGGKVKVSGKSKAVACKAVAEWEAKKARSKAKNVSEAEAEQEPLSAQEFREIGRLSRLSWLSAEEAREIAETAHYRRTVAEGLLTSLRDRDRTVVRTSMEMGFSLLAGVDGPEGRELTEAVLSAKQRRRSATIKRDGGKFPIPDKTHAKAALARIDQSDLSDEEKVAVRKRAYSKLGIKCDEKGHPLKEADFNPIHAMRVALDEIIQTEKAILEGMGYKTFPLPVAEATVADAGAATKPKAKPAPKLGTTSTPVKDRTGKAKNPEFEKEHPRAAKGRGGDAGEWIAKGAGMQGDPDDIVRQAQERLTQLGFVLSPDGRYGTVTEEAVKAFQEATGLEPTGKIDQATAETLRNPPMKDGKLYSTADLRQEEKAAEAGKGQGGGKSPSRSGRSRSDTSAAKEEGTSSPDLIRRGDGMRGEEDANVRKAQEQLDALGFDLGEGGVDGRFGEDTEEAVRAFQKKYGLRVDGIISDQTLRMLKELMDKRKKEADQRVTTGEAMPTQQADLTDLVLDLVEAIEERNTAHAAGDGVEFTRARAREAAARARVAKVEPNQALVRKQVEEALAEAATYAISFDPSLHPRNRIGQFIDVLRSLEKDRGGAGRRFTEVTIPGGITITKRLGRYRVRRGKRKVGSFRDEEATARAALRDAGGGIGVLAVFSEGPGALESVRVGDRVTIRTPQGQERTGRAVMRGPAGWVLNMGGAHGTPGIASERNIVKVKKMGGDSMGLRSEGVRSDRVMGSDAARAVGRFKEGGPDGYKAATWPDAKVRKRRETAVEDERKWLEIRHRDFSTGELPPVADLKYLTDDQVMQLVERIIPQRRPGKGESFPDTPAFKDYPRRIAEEGNKRATKRYREGPSGLADSGPELDDAARARIAAHGRESDETIAAFQERHRGKPPAPGSVASRRGRGASAEVRSEGVDAGPDAARKSRPARENELGPVEVAQKFPEGLVAIRPATEGKSHREGGSFVTVEDTKGNVLYSTPPMTADIANRFVREMQDEQGTIRRKSPLSVLRVRRDNMRPGSPEHVAITKEIADLARKSAKLPPLKERRANERTARERNWVEHLKSLDDRDVLALHASNLANKGSDRTAEQRRLRDMQIRTLEDDLRRRGIAPTINSESVTRDLRGPKTKSERADAAIQSAEQAEAKAAELRRAGNVEHARDYDGIAKRMRARASRLRIEHGKSRKDAR